MVTHSSGFIPRFSLLLLLLITIFGQLRLWPASSASFGGVSGAYLKSRCGFQSPNYTIKWAYEPQTRQVVFVLKAKMPVAAVESGDGNNDDGKAKQKQQPKQLLTGIGFGSESEMDFIGIAYSSINDQLDLVTGHTGGSGGDSFKVHSLPRDGDKEGNDNGGNVEGSVRGISLKRRSQDGSVIAEFARPLSAGGGSNGDSSRAAGNEEQITTDLSGCTTFFLITQWISYNPSEESSPTAATEISTTKFPVSSVAVQRKVCALADKCKLDVHDIQKQQQQQTNNEQQPLKSKHQQQDENRETAPGADKIAQLVDIKAKEEQIQKIHRDGAGEIAQSVDISGKGDPCAFTGSNYALQWSYNRPTDTVDFVMKLKRKQGRWWSAVGIGDNMSDMDIGVVFLENGQPKQMTDYFSTSYDVPNQDNQQDWQLDKAASSKEGDDVELYFSRKLVTSDTEKDRSLDGCVLFQFAANSGTYGPGYRIHKHQDWPDLYKACDLKKRCVRQKRQSSKEEENLPEISHSTDNNKAEGPQEGQAQKPSAKISHQNAAGGDGDKVISLLMQSLGPKIVQTVAESDAAGIHTKNARSNNSSPSNYGAGNSGAAIGTGTATVFPILGDGATEEELDKEGNYTLNGGSQEEAATGGENGYEEKEKNKPKTTSGGGEKLLKPLGDKRQQPMGIEVEQETATSQTTLSASTAEQEAETIAGGQPAESTVGSTANNNEQTYPPVESQTSSPTAESGLAISTSGSPFSLNAFIGGPGDAAQAQQPLLPVGEGPAVATGNNGSAAGTTAVLRISGEATSAEAGSGGGAEASGSSTAAAGGFGINQLLGEGSSTAASTFEGTTAVLPFEGGGGSTTGSYEESGSSTIASSASSSVAPGAAPGSAVVGNVPVGEGAITTIPAQVGSSTGQYGPEEGPNVEITASSIVPEQQPTTYGVPEATEISLSSTAQASETAPATAVTPAATAGSIASSTEASPTPIGVGGGGGMSGEFGEGGEDKGPATSLGNAISAGPSSPSSTAVEAPTTLAPPSSATASATPSSPIPSSTQAQTTPSSISPVGSSTAAASSANRGEEEEDTVYSTPVPQAPIEQSSSQPTNNPNNRIEENGSEVEHLPTANGKESENATTAVSKPQTPASSGSAELEERGIRLPVATSKCDALRPDLPICQSYMDTYMERVKDWAERHGEAVDNQFPKACKLLSAVPHVPTLCCQIFADKCADHI